MSEERRVILIGLRQLHCLNRDDLTLDVIGNSMWPTLHSGDKVLVKSSEIYRCGDILVFDSREHLIVHRLVRLETVGLRFITKGDNQRCLDLPISADKLLGRVTTIIRNDKQISIRPKRQYAIYRLLQFSWLITAIRRRLSL